MDTFNGIKGGDIVRYRPSRMSFPDCDPRTWRDVRAQRLLCFPTHVVCDAGNGRPVVVDADNYVSHRSANA
jgi:hypothetical protein